jgi:hypothetical protein
MIDVEIKYLKIKMIRDVIISSYSGISSIYYFLDHLGSSTNERLYECLGEMNLPTISKGMEDMIKSINSI